MPEPTQQQKTHPQSKVNIRLDPTGQLNFEGELNQETSEILDKLFQQAEYYRAKSKEVETERTQAKQQVDSITMTFVGCVLMLLIFGSYTAIRAIGQAFSHPAQPATSYRVYQP
jgi:cytochrome c-type biogenesis protein CcmH/NrfG